MGGRVAYSSLALTHAERHISQDQKFGARADFEVLPQDVIYISGITANNIIEMYARGIFIRTDGNTGIDVEIKLFEDCEVAGGVVVEIESDNRNGMKESSFEIKVGTNVPILGIELKRRGNKIVTDKQVVSTQVYEVDLYEMKKNTKYVLSIENYHSSNSVEGSLYWSFTEEV